MFIIEDDMFSSAIDYLGTSRKKAEVSKKKYYREKSGRRGGDDG
ncbi:hypothetical protein [Bacteroides heparinolyticus]